MKALPYVHAANIKGDTLRCFTIDQTSTNIQHAGSKARSDATAILTGLGFERLDFSCSFSDRPADIVRDTIRIHHDFPRLLDCCENGDVALVQFPFRCFSAHLGNTFCASAHKRKVSTIAFIHDLDVLRKHGVSGNPDALDKIRDDRSFLRDFDCIISHNERMTDYLANGGLDRSRIINLELFDYLRNDPVAPRQANPGFHLVSIAGNLSAHKAGYAYELGRIQSQSFKIDLYGPGYTLDSTSFCTYKGVLPPDELPRHLTTGFGLVWDGDSIDGCDGPYGNYLRFNNPHKASLYLACGIPLIVWDQSALASFVQGNNIGLCVSSLSELPQIFSSLTLDTYLNLRNSALKLQKRVTSGFYLERAVDAALGRLGVGLSASIAKRTRKLKTEDA